MLLTGASFAVPENGWFEIACEDLGAEPINKAVSGEAIYHTARRMNSGTFYTTAELDRIDVFVIGHVHNQNVANEQWLKDSWEDYTSIATTTDYSVAYDYVIKRYIADCRALKDNPESRYYGTAEGKPAKIILCTHWHDGRTTYNPAIRKLAAKWGFPLVEFDTNIGFSKDDVAPGEPQPSLAMAHDTETINGVKYGWHPLRGSASHIQRRMAQIFLDVAARVLGVEVPFECSLAPVSPLVLAGEEAAVMMCFRAGQYPFTVTYCAGGTDFVGNTLVDMPLIVEAAAGTAEVDFSVGSASDICGTEAILPEKQTVYVADKAVAPTFDGYVHEAYKEQSFTGNATLQLKNGDNWSRKIYITFPTDGIDIDASCVAVRVFFDSYVLGTLNNEKRPMDGIETLDIEGNTNVYGPTLKWSTHGSHVFEPIASTSLTTGMEKKWIGWDVTDWVKAKVTEGAKHLTFRISTPYRWRSLTNFVATENTDTPHLAPQLLIAKSSTTSGVDSAVAPTSPLSVIGDTLGNFSLEPLRIFSPDGRILYSGTPESLSLSFLPSGLYIAATPSPSVRFLR